MIEGSRLLRDFQTLFDSGAAGALTDAQLLDRFEARRGDAEAAFEGLVTRHAPMVLGVCRRVLRDPNDVDDAFQATFLILATRAGSIRERGALGGWLARVALRMALRADEEGKRRREFERQGSGGEGLDSASSADREEVRSAVDEEIDRLPDRFRRPVVLCYLEGLTHDEAALRLRCPVGTVRSRLSRARDRLKARLTRRGVAPADLATLAPLPASATAIEAATRAALQPSMAPAGASFLKKGFLMKMLWARWKRAGLLLMACGSAAGAVALAALPRNNDPPKPVQAREAVVHVATPPVVDGKRAMPPGQQAKAVEFAPDGRTVAARCDDGTVKLLDAATGEGRAILRVEGGPVRAVAFAPDGRTLVGVCDDNRLMAWEPAKGELRRTWPGYGRPSTRFLSASFSPDGRTLAIAGRFMAGTDPVFDFWLVNASTGEPVWGHMGRRELGFRSATFSPDGESLATPGSSSVRIWDARTGEVRRTIRVDRDVTPQHLAYSPDGTILAGAGWFMLDRRMIGQVILWDPRTGAVLRTLDAPGRCSAVAFSPDGKTLAAGGRGPVKEYTTKDGGEGHLLVSETRLWDVATGERLWTSEGDLDSVTSLAFAPDGKSLVRCDDETVAVIDASTGKVLRTLMTIPKRF